MAILVSSLFCSAFILAVAVASRRYSWAGWIGLVPLFLSVRTLAPLWAMSCGALWGFCLYFFSILGFNVSVTPSSSLFVLIICTPAVYALLGAYFTRRVGFRPLFLAGGWVAVEFILRPPGLGHGLLAGTQGDTGIIRHVGIPMGYLFIAFLIAFINAKLLYVVVCINVERITPSYPRFLIESREWVCAESLYYSSRVAVNLCRSRAPPIWSVLYNRTANFINERMDW